MIIQYLVDTILSDKIKDLPFIERYGGVTEVLSSKVLGESNTLKLKKFPVACCITSKDCNDNGLYSDLVPDETKTSISYWEITNPMTNVGETPNLSNFNKKRYRGTARLVVWLNLAKLGTTNIESGVSKCNNATFTIPSIMKALSIQGTIDNGMYAGNKIYIEPRKIVTGLKDIFGKYDYPDTLNYYLYPYSYYAIDVSFEMDMCYNNEFEYPVGTPIDCISYACEDTPPGPVIPPIVTNGLVLDLDAEKGVNSGTPLEDERVFLWSDQSGNNNDFVQTSGVFRPKFINNGINSMPSIYFDTSSFIERTDRLLSTNEATFIIVMERVGLPHIGNGAVAWLAGNSLLSFVQLRESAAQYQFNFNNSLTSDVTAVSNNKFMLSFVKRDTNADFYLSDTLVNTTTGTLSMAGTLYEIGKGTSNYFNGYVSRVLLYDRALTNLEIADNFINLKDKYNT